MAMKESEDIRITQLSDKERLTGLIFYRMPTGY